MELKLKEVKEVPYQRHYSHPHIQVLEIKLLSTGLTEGALHRDLAHMFCEKIAKEHGYDIDGEATLEGPNPHGLLTDAWTIILFEKLK